MRRTLWLLARPCAARRWRRVGGARRASARCQTTRARTCTSPEPTLSATLPVVSVSSRAMTGFHILGPVEVWNGEQRLDLGGPRQVTLLALFLLHANRALSTDVLIDTVWGERRMAGDNRLGMAIARLRKTLAPLPPDDESVLQTVAGGYLLRVQPGALDADVFRGLVSEGRGALETGDAKRANEKLREALALWRGPPLAEVTFEDFAQ